MIRGDLLKGIEWIFVFKCFNTLPFFLEDIELLHPRSFCIPNHLKESSLLLFLPRYVEWKQPLIYIVYVGS